ncbi:hypothetical protein AB0870_11860 [Microbacterium proteolyticum]|uniref:hypothetical protein n=1 Tax=Microbacterium proteolyticum TaxID=1572644 RepID=UPI002417E0DF|nr:hypothetical protein [Microbacterium proteolyticum]
MRFGDEDDIARGKANAEVMELARNHCLRMEFEPWGGQGMLELIYELPLNMRRIKCVKAHGSGASAVFGPLARSFYTEHCIGCSLRKPSGRLPTLAAAVENEERQEAEAARLASERDAERAEERRRRSLRRGALKATVDPAMAKVLSDLDILDTDDDADSAEQAAAVRRVAALAEKSPQIFTDDVVEEAVGLVRRGHSRVLGPLRVLARARSEWRSVVVDAAFDALGTGFAEDAARVLVQFPDQAEAARFSESVVRSLLYVAYGPRADSVGFTESRTSTDPATLKLVVDKATATMAMEFAKMLPGPSGASPLLLPGDVSRTDPGSNPQWDRATAAAAIGQLALSREPVAAQFVPLLIRNLRVNGDEHDHYPHAAVQRAVGLFILRGVRGAEEAWAAAAEHVSEEQREVFFKVWWHLSRLCDSDRGWGSGAPTLSEVERSELRERVFATSILRVDGSWGYDVARAAADIIFDLARDDPGWATAHVDALLGGFLAALTAAESPRSRVLLMGSDAPDHLAQIEWQSRSMVMRSAASILLSAVQAAAKAEPQPILRSVLQMLSLEREEDRPIDVSYRLLRLVGEIGRDEGGQPGVLARLIPELYTYLMNGSPAMVVAAIGAWTEVASRHPLPTLFDDLLPVLMQNQYVSVITALLDSLPRLRMVDSARREGLRYALEILSTSAVSGANAGLVRPGIECAARLIQTFPEDRSAAERLLLATVVKLPPHEIDQLLRVSWSPAARTSVEYARIRLARVIDQNYNSPYNRRFDEEEVSLLECGPGLLGLEVAELRAAALSFGPERVVRGLHIVEAAWRAGRESDARVLADALASSIPETPAFTRQRILLNAVSSALSGQSAADSGEQEFDENGFPSFLYNLQQQTDVRATLRRVVASVGTTDLADDARVLRETAATLAAGTRRATPTAAYLRLASELFTLGGQLLLQEKADLNDAPNDVRGAKRRLVRRTARSLAERVNTEMDTNDPLAGRLAAEVAAVLASDDETDPIELVRRWADIPLPLVIIEGAPLADHAPWEQKSEREPDPVAVAMISVDNQLLTGAAVLSPNTVYQLGVEMHVDEWPDWADRLDVELVGGLSPSEISVPTMNWTRPDDFAGVLYGEGTLVLRFSLPAGQPAPPLAVVASWSGRGERGLRTARLDIAGHAQIRLRPFDASRDAMTTYDVVDERLLHLYSSLPAAGYLDEEVQAFCRLFTAVCRSGFRLTWNKSYRRGTQVSERKFHDDLFDDLLSDPELEGRVERGSPLGLGFLDIRHDRITAELKVERKTAATEESAPKYMGQTTQYAAADGRHLSILAILDMSPKDLPIGTPENYLFWLRPALHGLDNSEAPSLVAVIIVNGNMPVPSSWSRRRTPRGEFTP